MADRIEINFTANVREVTRGTDEISDSLKDTERDLDDLGRGGEQSLEKITDAQKDVDTGAKDLSGTVKGELTNAFEQWDGTAGGAVSSVGSALQGLAGLIPGIGGLIGAGLGVVVTEWAKTWGDSAEEVEQRTADMFDDMIASGNRFTSQEFIQKALADLFKDEGKTSEIERAADALGLSAAVIAEAYAGVPEAIDTVIAKTDELADKQLLSADPNSELIAQYRAIEATVQGVADSTTSAADRAALFEATVNQNTKRWEETGQAVDEVGNKINNLPDPTVNVAVDTAAADRQLRNWSGIAYTKRINLDIRDSLGRRAV